MPIPRIDLKVGDTLFVKDIEQVITNIVHAYGPDGDSMRLDCMDPLMAQTITQLILRLKRKLRKTSIVVTHDVRLAERVADRIVMLCEGRVCFFGSPMEWAASGESEVANFRSLDAMPGGAGSV